MRKILAFTLAETLVVIGIIGVVSALTLPNLNSSTGDKEKIAKVKKLYQNLADATGRATAIYGPLEDWPKSPNVQTIIEDRISEFFKISKDCGTTNPSQCFPSSIKTLSGATQNNATNNSSCIIVADGTSICFTTYYSINIDIDGPNKGKNTWGQDIFAFQYSSDDKTFIPYHCNQSDYTLSNCITTVSGFLSSSMGVKKGTGSGQMASTWIINYDNMDYLKLDSSGKCPNGTTPTEQNPRCK